MRVEELFPYLAACASFPTPLRPMGGCVRSPTITSAGAPRWWWLDTLPSPHPHPTVPVPSITNSPCKRPVRTASAHQSFRRRRKYAQVTRVQHFILSYIYTQLEGGKCSKFSVQIFLQSVISALALVTRNCMNKRRVKKVRQVFFCQYVTLHTPVKVTA